MLHDPVYSHPCFAPGSQQAVSGSREEVCHLQNSSDSQIQQAAQEEQAAPQRQGSGSSAGHPETGSCVLQKKRTSKNRQSVTEKSAERMGKTLLRQMWS